LHNCLRPVCALSHLANVEEKCGAREDMSRITQLTKGDREQEVPSRQTSKFLDVSSTPRSSLPPLYACEKSSKSEASPFSWVILLWPRQVANAENWRLPVSHADRGLTAPVKLVAFERSIHVSQVPEICPNPILCTFPSKASKKG
jgi:hypothetical protein